MFSKNFDESELLRESLLDLVRANIKETESRMETEALLAGLNILTDYNNRDKMFENLLQILRSQFNFENAFIMAAKDGIMRIIATTSDQFHEISCTNDDIKSRMKFGKPLLFFDIAEVPAWQKQTLASRQGVRSTLQMLLRDHADAAALICTHSQRGFFSEKHLRLSARFAPLASQALINLDNRLELEIINSQLQIEMSARKKAQAQIVNNSKMAALGEMAGSIAHEINTPLCAIILNAEMIETKCPNLDDSGGEILRRAKSIMEIGQRISKIIGGLKNISRDATNDENTVFTTRELIEHTIALCSEKFKNNGIRLQIEENLLETPIHGKIIQLSQTLLNLLNNAYDAIYRYENKWIKIQVEIKGQKTELRVTDSGNGIPPDVIEKIFQPFFTTKRIGEGTGLGLSISRSILIDHSGDLFYDGTGSNTCFVIQLPVVQTAKQEIA